MIIREDIEEKLFFKAMTTCSKDFYDMFFALESVCMNAVVGCEKLFCRMTFFANHKAVILIRF